MTRPRPPRGCRAIGGRRRRSLTAQRPITKLAQIITIIIIIIIIIMSPVLTILGTTLPITTGLSRWQSITI
jgi:hypothetical protein